MYRKDVLGGQLAWWLRCQLRRSHPILEYLGLKPGYGSYSTSPIMQTLESSSKGSNNWVPATHVRDLNSPPASAQLSPGPCRHLGSEPADESFLLFCCCLIFLSNKLKKKKVYILLQDMCECMSLF